MAWKPPKNPTPNPIDSWVRPVDVKKTPPPKKRIKF